MGRNAELSNEILDEQLSVHGVYGFEKIVFGMIVDGKTLMEVCEYYGMMYSVMWEWLNNEPGRLGEYRSALKGRADALMGEVVGIADGSGDAKLMVDTRFKLAGKLDAGRFGDSSKVEVSGSVSLIGLLASLKELPASQDVIEVLPDPAVPEVLPAQIVIDAVGVGEV